MCGVGGFVSTAATVGGHHQLDTEHRPRECHHARNHEWHTAGQDGSRRRPVPGTAVLATAQPA